MIEHFETVDDVRSGRGSDSVQTLAHGLQSIQGHHQSADVGQIHFFVSLQIFMIYYLSDRIASVCESLVDFHKQIQFKSTILNHIDPDKRGKI